MIVADFSRFVFVFIPALFDIEFPTEAEIFNFFICYKIDE